MGFSTDTLIRPSLGKTGAGKPERAHLVGAQGGMSGAAAVTNAMVYGTEITALCGYRWVPTRDAEGLKVCEECTVVMSQKKSGQ